MCALISFKDCLVWTTFLKSVLNLFLFYGLVFWPQGMWDLSFPTKDWTCTPCLGKWILLNHWTTREVRLYALLMSTGRIPSTFGNFGFQVTWHLHTREFQWDDIDAMNISCDNLSFWMIGRIRRPQVSESVTRSVVSDSLQPHGLKSSRLLCPWDSPGNNTGVGSHFLLQGSSWPGIEPRSPVLQADSLLSELRG